MSRTPSGVDLPRARREDEAQRVGAERGREQRVVFVGDAADLDEHQPARRPTAGAVSSPSNAPGSVGAYERLADEDRVEPGGGHPRRRRSPLRTALSATAITSAGRRAASDSRDTEILGERREVAAVDADDARAGRERALDLALRRALRRAHRARGRRRARAGRRAPRRPVSRPTISRIASAPIARASYTWTSSIVKSLRNTGSSRGLARDLQIGDRATEVRRVGEHRQRRGAAVPRTPWPSPPGRGRARAHPSTANGA